MAIKLRQPQAIRPWEAQQKGIGCIDENHGWGNPSTRSPVICNRNYMWAPTKDIAPRILEFSADRKPYESSKSLLSCWNRHKSNFPGLHMIRVTLPSSH